MTIKSVWLAVVAVSVLVAVPMPAQNEPGTAPGTLAPIAAAPVAASTGSTAFNGIAHIAVRVKDIAASVAFYNKLGFEQAFAMTGKDGSVSQSFLKINDRQFIEIYPVGPANPHPGFLHLCFEGQDLNAIYADYVAHGLTPNIAVRKAGAGNLLFTMKGPQQFSDPQNIEYTQYMPGSLHTNDIGKHLGADRVADKMVQVDLAMADPGAAKMFYADKLGFKAGPKPGTFALPGDSGELVKIVGLETLGARSSIVLATESLAKAKERLKAQGVAYTVAGAGVEVKDPDGNIIEVEPAAQPNRSAVHNMHLNTPGTSK